MRGASKSYPVPEQQTDASLSQAPTSGTQYTVLDTAEHVRIISIAAVCTWTVQPTPLQIHITIDGQTMTFSKTDPVSATWYFATKIPSTAAADQELAAADLQRYMSYLLEGRSVKVTAEITGGTVSNLSARVKYAKW